MWPGLFTLVYTQISPGHIWTTLYFGNNLNVSKVLFRKKLRTAWSQRMLAIIRCRIFLSSSLPSKINIKKYMYRAAILPLVLYECEIWSLILREERRLRAFENRVLRRIFGPKRGEVTGEWRKLRNKELNDLHSSPNTVRIMKFRRTRWAEHVARRCESRGMYRDIGGETWKENTTWKTEA